MRRGRFLEGPACPAQQKEEIYTNTGSKEPEVCCTSLAVKCVTAQNQPGHPLTNHMMGISSFHRKTGKILYVMLDITSPGQTTLEYRPCREETKSVCNYTTVKRTGHAPSLPALLSQRGCVQTSDSDTPLSTRAECN